MMQPVSHWANHWEAIAKAWRSDVEEQDMVLIPGDISWAMYTENVRLDLEAIAALPGRKAILRGNHDYWWSSLSKIKAVLPPSIEAVQNNCIVYGARAICGSRGWTVPGSTNFSQKDARIYEREVIRLELSLKAAQKTGLSIGPVMMHFPPLNEQSEDNGFTMLFEKYGVTRVLYGHLHGRSLEGAFEGERNGVEYTLVSCDHLGFMPKKIM